MKKLIILLMLTSTIKVSAQCLSISATTTLASCSTCCDGSFNITVFGGCSPYMYSFSPSTMGGCAGTIYTITVTDNGCCPITTHTLLMNYNIATNIITQDNFTNDLSIFPNPSNGNFQITSTAINDNTTIKIIDALGQQIKTLYTISNKNIEIKITDEAQGIYWLELNFNNSLIRKKIIIQN